MITVTPAQQRQLLLGLLAAIGVAAWWMLMLGPQQALWAERSAALRALRQQVDDVRQGVAQQPAMEQELARLAETSGETTSARRPEEQLPNLLQAITQMAQAGQVRIVAMKPMVELSSLIPSPAGYLELPVAFQASAGYHQLGAFLDALERSPRLARVGALQIGPQTEDLWRHQVTMVLQVYLVPWSESS